MKCPKCGSENVKSTMTGRKWHYYICLDCAKQIRVLIPNISAEDYCGIERPARKVFCQLPKGHQGSHRAVVFWED